MNPSKANGTEQQDYSERSLQLLCLIAQSLHRIEAHLGSAGTPQQRSKIVAFHGGGRP
jgi:hypothetical protein